MLANVVIFSQTAQQTVPGSVFLSTFYQKPDGRSCTARQKQTDAAAQPGKAGTTAAARRSGHGKRRSHNKKNKRKAGQRPPRLCRRTTDNKPDRDTPIVSQQHRRQAGRHPLPTTPPHHEEAPKAVPRLSSRKGKRISRKAYFK